MKRLRTHLGAVTTAVALGAMALATMAGPAHALGNPPHPALSFDHVISSHPFSGAPGNAIDIEGLGYIPTNPGGTSSMWVADDNGDRVWEIDSTTGAYKSQLRGGNPASNPANVDFLDATEVGTNRTCDDPALIDPTFLDVTGTNQVDNGNYECLSRTDDFESLMYDPVGDVLYLTSGNCCTAGFPAVYLDSDNNPLTPPTPSSYPYHPTVWKLTRDGSGFKPTSWRALPEGEDPTAGGWRPGSGVYFGHNKTVQTYNVNSGALVTERTLSSLPADIVGLAFTDANTVFVTTATPNTSSGRTTATSDSTIHRFDISGSTWTENTTWKLPLKSIGVPGGSVDDDGVIDARDLAIVSSGGVDKFYVSDGYDGRASGDHPIYVYNLVDAPPPPPPPTGPAWHYEIRNGNGSGVSTDHFGGGNSLLQYGAQLHSFYGDTSKSSLSHSWWDGAKWNAENLDGNGKNTSDHVGEFVQAVQYGSMLQLFYSDATTHTLRHAWWDGAKWNFESLDGAGGANGRTSDHVAGGTIAVRQYGAQLQVFYPDDTTHKLRHAWWDGAKWNFENLDAATTLPSAPDTYVATTQYGGSFQVVYKTSGGSLRHSWYDTAWHSETLDGTGGISGSTHSVGDYVSILQFGSQLDIVYQDSSASTLRHAWWNGAKWSFETLDGTGGNIPGHTNNHVGLYPAVINYAGGLHVFYQDTTTGALRHAWYAGGWHVEILDGNGSLKPGASSSGSTGLFNSIVLYGSQLQITYFDHGNADRFRQAWYG